MNEFKKIQVTLFGENYCMVLDEESIDKLMRIYGSFICGIHGPKITVYTDSNPMRVPPGLWLHL